MGRCGLVTFLPQQSFELNAIELVLKWNSVLRSSDTYSGLRPNSQPETPMATAPMVTLRSAGLLDTLKLRPY